MRILLLSLLLLFSSKLSATGQIPDYLIQDKDTIAIQSNPLEEYFKKNPIDKDLITTRSSALWRGYIAFFKIIDNKLILENIYKQNYIEDANGKNTEKLISIYQNIFGNDKNFECSFYNGVLICPYGELVEYVHMGYSSIYENYNLIEIKNGQLVKEQKFKSDEFIKLKVKHYQKFKQSEEYKKMFDEFLKASNEMDKEIENSFGELSKEDKKRKKKNKYLYEKEKEIEKIKMTEQFLFLYISDNIKTIDIDN